MGRESHVLIHQYDGLRCSGNLVNVASLIAPGAFLTSASSSVVVPLTKGIVVMSTIGADVMPPTLDNEGVILVLSLTTSGLGQASLWRALVWTVAFLLSHSVI